MLPTEKLNSLVCILLFCLVAPGANNKLICNFYLFGQEFPEIIKSC